MALGILTLLFAIILAILPLGEAKDVQLKVKGIVASVFTPIDDYGYVNFNVIPQYAQSLKDRGINGVLVGGYNGEGTKFSIWDRRQLLSTWIEAATPLGLFVLFQVGGIPLPDAQDLASFAEQIGVSAILIYPDCIYKPKNPKELVYYVGIIASSAPNTPILYYHIPQVTGVNVDMVKFFDLASDQIDNFKGLKVETFDTALKLRGRMEGDQRVFISNSVYLGPAALAGFDSFILSDATVFPRLVDLIVRYGKSGDRRRVNSFSQRLIDLNEVISAQGNNLAALKATMSLVTDIDVGRIKDPTLQLTAEQENNLERRLKDEGIKVKQRQNNNQETYGRKRIYPPRPPVIYYDEAGRGSGPVAEPVEN
ncbi:N-acetylneuraminate lyase-like [Trichoplusia ni]|uniref:N-acetylneuraminate lyase n=1 Tax=Trichoplusia ni TaxID=7111 RepID=A0A7E5WQV0_TRINI|nr:N-acetylneuraminate lyase-like [Trichoplusia ni]